MNVTAKPATEKNLDGYGSPKTNFGLSSGEPHGATRWRGQSED